MCDDPAVTVTGLTKKPSECEVTISLSQDVVRDITYPGVAVAGVYKTDGTYRHGRPVLEHSGGLFTLSVWGGFWVVESDVDSYLMSGSAPSLCPADHRAAAARNERVRQTNWSFWSKRKRGGWPWPESSGITVKCKKCFR